FTPTCRVRNALTVYGHPARRNLVWVSPSIPRSELPFRAASAALYGSLDGCRYSRKPTLNKYGRQRSVHLTRMNRRAYSRASRRDLELSTPFHKYGHVCDEGFLAQTRRERRAYPSGVCKE